MLPVNQLHMSALIRDLVFQAGSIIKTAYKDPASLATELKDDATVVTIADRTIHQLVIDRMTSAYPDIPVIGEEGASAHDGDVKKGFWLNVDEVDGTGALTLGVPTSMVMIALMNKTKPVCSALYSPFTERMYTAHIDRGAWCNDKPIRVKPASKEAPVVSVIGWPKRAKGNMLVERMFDSVIPALHAMGCELYNVGSNLPDTLVAHGTFDVAIFPGRSLHDTSAGDLLVREAGGVTSDLRGHELQYGDETVFGHVFANNRDTHAKIMPIIETAFAH